MGRVATFVSYRLGGTDGVSIEAAKWAGALGTLGFEARRVAGEVPRDGRPTDVIVPWLALSPAAGAGAPDPAALARLLDRGDLVVVENVCSLPLNREAARGVAAALERTRARIVLHHHDLPWQRGQTADVTDLPPRIEGALHVTINAQSRAELAERGIDAVQITNAFDVDAPPGDRDATRAQLGFGPDDVVVLQPARAIPRKNVPDALEYAERLDPLVRPRRVVFWLTGPAEDGYEAELDRLLAGARVPVTLGLGPGPADAYAAADVVVFPSTVEGFGNPVVESVIARRPLVVGSYPVLDEILAEGFEFFGLADPETMAAWLAAPDPELLDRNLDRARRAYSLAELPGRIDSAFRRPRVDDVVSDDPVAAKRARIARGVKLAKQVGYLALLVAIVAFVIAAASGFPGWAVGVTIAGLVVAIVVLPIPIILGYGIRAAEREERGGGSFH